MADDALLALLTVYNGTMFMDNSGLIHIPFTRNLIIGWENGNMFMDSCSG